MLPAWARGTTRRSPGRTSTSVAFSRPASTPSWSYDHPAGEEIGEETHQGDQILFFVEGEGEAILEGESSPVSSGDYVFVPAGTLHNFVNTGSEPLRLLTTYAPPEHPHGTVHRTKAEADAAEEH